MSKYREEHILAVDDDGRATVRIAVLLQDVEPPVARLFVLRVLDGAEAIASPEPAPVRPGQVVRPQTSGPCVHIDTVDDADPIEVQVLGYACRHPARQCPHLDAPEIVCPLKDALYAMRAVASLRAECEAEQSRGLATTVPQSEYILSPRPAPVSAEGAAPAAPGEDHPPDDAPLPPGADEPPAPPDEALEPSDSPTEVPPLEEEIVFQDGMRWTEAEIGAIASADGPTEAIRRYREAFPTSLRGDGSITTRLYIVRKKRSARSIHDRVGMLVEIRLRSSPHYGRIGRVTRVNEEACELMVQFDDDTAAYWVSPEGVAAVEGS